LGNPRGKGIPLPKFTQLGASSKGKSEVAGSLLSQGERPLRSSLKRSATSLKGAGNVKGGLMAGDVLVYPLKRTNTREKSLVGNAFSSMLVNAVDVPLPEPKIIPKSKIRLQVLEVPNQLMDFVR
jgi:hypothetical protein